MFKEKSNREETKNIDSKKKPAQSKKNDVKVHEGTNEGKCVALPVLPRAQTKKSDKIHPLKVKEDSSVDKSTTEDLHMKNPTLKKCVDRAGKPIIIYVGEFFMKNFSVCIQRSSAGVERIQSIPVTERDVRLEDLEQS